MIYKLPVLTIILALFAVSDALAQAPRASTSLQDPARPETQAHRKQVNTWRETPVDVRTQQDSEGSTVRSIRNRYWADKFPTGVNVSPSGGIALGFSPEIPEPKLCQDCIWVVGTFVSFKRFITSNGEATYSEISLR